MPNTAENRKSASCGEALAKYLNATAGVLDVKLPDLYQSFNQGMIGSDRFAKAIVLFTRLQDSLAVLTDSTDNTRVRRCGAECEKWFFARKKDQRFCNPNCRRKAQVLTHEQKQHRRAYMRHYMKNYYAQNFSAWRAGSNL